MALFARSLRMIMRNSRLFSVSTEKFRQSIFMKLKELPVVLELNSKSKLNNEGWTNVKKELLETETGITLHSVDAVILQLCNSSKNLALGKSYLKYLEETKCELTAAVIGKYFQLLYNCKEDITELDLKEILEMYDNLRLKHQLLDAFTAESCVLVVSLTERWKEALELLEMVKISSFPSTASYSALIIASYNHNEPDIAWKYLNELVEHQKSLCQEIYTAYLNYCSKNFNELDIHVREIEKFFHFLGDYDVIPDKICMEHIKTAFNKLGWSGTFTGLTNKGICRNCHHKLAPLKLSEEDFSYLSKSVLDRVLVGNDIYANSTPYEVTKFMNFIEKTKPYDIVIDGLNVAYKNIHNKGSNAAKQLASVVRYFHHKNQVALVLGRKHILKWDQQSINYVKNNSFLFLIDDLSSDDSCLLYATLASGPETKFVSVDLMRNHKFVLGDIALKRIFKRWQMSHQCFFSFNGKKVIVMPPLNYLPIAQKGEDCWHLPYTTLEASARESYEPPSHWLCLNRVKPQCE